MQPHVYVDECTSFTCELIRAEVQYRNLREVANGIGDGS